MDRTEEERRRSLERTYGAKVDKHSRKKPKKKMKQKMPMTPSEMLVQAEVSLKEGRADQARADAEQALANSRSENANSNDSSLPALNLLAQINLELGDGEAARDYFLQAVDLDPEGLIPESQGGGAEKFLWLAQLSEDGGEDSVQWFEKGAEILKRTIAAQIERQKGAPDDSIKATMKKLAGALCGIVEIYMTDLS